jgi:amino-acid N-acetyltransferase
MNEHKPVMIVKANNDQRQMIVSLLEEEQLPVSDLPAWLEHFFVAMDGMKVIGVIGVEQYGEIGLLRSLVVSKEYRNQNIASVLIEALEQYARLGRIESMYLLTETAPRYFEKKGYRVITREEIPAPVQRSSEFSHVCPESAVVMNKIL